MEEQIIKTISTSRITLKKLTKSYNWEIATSDGETLKEIIKTIEEANNLMLEKYGERRI